MDLSITDASALRVLSRTVQTAAKLCEHVQFTRHDPCLHFRLLTPTHSTFALFRFHSSFFSSISLPPSAASYKLSSRLLPPLLKAPQTISSIRLSTHENHRLCLTLQTQTGLTKRFLLPLLEGRISSVRTSPLRNILQTSASFLSDLLANFHAKLDEITLIPSHDSLTLLSFVDDTANPSNAFLRTEITVDARQFDEHVFVTENSPSNLTFLCRPLRNVVEYCDALDVPIRIMYDRPACPLQLEMSLPAPSGQSYFDAFFVFASRVPPQLSQQQPQLQLPQQHQLQSTATATAYPNANANQRPMPIDAVARPLPMQTDTDNLPDHQPSAVGGRVTPMRSARRHGQQPLIAQSSQVHDHPDHPEDDDGDNDQHQSQQQRQQSQQQYVRQPLRPAPDILNPTLPSEPPQPPATFGGVTPVAAEYHPSPVKRFPRQNQNRQVSTAPVPESDPVRESDDPLPESNPLPESDALLENDPFPDSSLLPSNSLSVVQPTPIPASNSTLRQGSNADDDDDDDDEFVEGTPPPEYTQD